MKQFRFRELERLSHTDLLWMVMKNEYGPGWTLDIDTNPEEFE